MSLFDSRRREEFRGGANLRALDIGQKGSLNWRCVNSSPYGLYALYNRL
jgi:hypothetical protein